MNSTPEDASSIGSIAIGNAQQLVQKLLKRGNSVANRYRNQARVNESFYNGEQLVGLVAGADSSNARFDPNVTDPDLPTAPVNIFTHLCQVWVSLITKNRPSAKAVAASHEPEDAYRADTANAVLRYLRQELDTANKIKRVALYGLQGGTAGLKIVYDQGSEKVAWSPLTVFNYVIDPSVEDYKDALWVIFENWISEEEAQALYELNGISADPALQKYVTASGDVLEGVLHREAWLRPGASKDFPDGAVVVTCGGDEMGAVGEVVDIVTEYPLVQEDDSGKPQYLLPLVLFHVRHQRQSPYGRTPASSVVPLQRRYNDLCARIERLIKKVTAVHRLLPKRLKEDVNFSEDTDIYFDEDKDGIAAAAMVRFTEPANLNERLYQERTFLEEKMPQVIGLNDATAGTDSKVRSGRAIDNIVELDAQSNADATESLEQMILDADKLTLAIVQLFYTDQRKMLIADDDAMDVMLFDSADIMGVNLRLEPAVETDDWQEGQQAKLGADTEAGVASPTQALEAQNGPGYALSKRGAEQMVDDFLAGAPLDMLPDDVDPNVMKSVIDKRKTQAVRQGQRDVYAQLVQLLKEVMDKAAIAADQTPQQPAGGEPPEGSPAPAAAN